jgi:hypothetical protein
MAKTPAKPKPKQPDNWLAHTHPSREGDFTAKAKAHNMSVQEYANWCLRAGSQCDKLTKQQAIYARNAGAVSKANAKAKP